VLRKIMRVLSLMWWFLNTNSYFCVVERLHCWSLFCFGF